MKISQSQLKLILVRSLGNVLAATKIINKEFGVDITRDAIYKRIQNNPSLRNTVEKITEEVKDIAEHELFNKIKKGDLRAITYFLDRRAKDRGYMLKMEQELSGEFSITHSQKTDYSNWPDKDLKAFLDLKRKHAQSSEKDE